MRGSLESFEVRDYRAEMVLVSLVEVDRPARRRCAPDADRHGVDHLLKLPLAPPQRLFGVHLIVYVVTEAVPLDDAPVLIPQWLRAARHPVIDAVGAAQAIAHRESLAGGEAATECVPEPCCIVRMDESSMIAASRLMPGLSVSATSRPRKSTMRLLKKIGSPSGVRRQTWLGTMSTSCESSRSRSAMPPRFGAM